MIPIEEQLERFLKCYHRGVTNSIGAPELAGEFRTTTRNINSRVRNLRLSGVPICGESEHGYWWPTSRLDAQRTVMSLKSRVTAIREVIDALEDGLDREFGEERLFA
jgi:hypothetical protein